MQFVELRVVKGYGSGYEQEELLTETRCLRHEWSYPPVEFNKHDWTGKVISRRRRPECFESDAPGGHFLSARAANALRDVWERYGELLPLSSKDGEFFIFHCMNELDAVDPPRCEFRGTSIVKYVFRPEVIRGQDIFRPSFPYRWPVFVSQLIVHRIEAAGLKGFEFTPVWDEQLGSISDKPEYPPAVASMHAGSCRRMTGEERRQNVEEPLALAGEMLGVDVAVGPAEAVLACIREEGQSIQSRASRSEEALVAATLLGSVWGELICRDFGWEWAMLGSEPTAGIVSPTRSHVVYPDRFFYELLTFGGRGPKSHELYNMIKAGLLPAAEPGALLVPAGCGTGA